MNATPLGILGAMPEEVSVLAASLEQRVQTCRAGRSFEAGTLWGTPAVVVFSRWGKVASASTAAELIISYGVRRLIFVGIAGALTKDVARGDVVVARNLVQHDLDASPYFPPTQVPLLNISRLPTHEATSDQLLLASERFVSQDLYAAAGDLWRRAGLSHPRVCRADIASGDQIIFSRQDRERVLTRAPGAVCVEMEGAAVAQVCYEHGVEFACVRTISDNADEDGQDHVKPFFEGLAGVYGAGIIRQFLSPALDPRAS